MDQICTNCGYEGRGKKILRGSRGFEIIIWTVLFFPGPLYSLYRRVGTRYECPHCHLTSMVRKGSDAGWLAQRKFDIELGVTPRKIPIKAADFSKLDPVEAAPLKPPIPEPSQPRKPVNPDKW